MSNDAKKTSLMRNLGAFFGHIAKGVRTQVNKEGDEIKRREVKRTVEEEVRGDVILRRTTIEEVEIKTKTPRSDTASEESTDAPSDESPDL